MRGTRKGRSGRCLVADFDVDAEIPRRLSHNAGAPGFSASAARITASNGS